MKRFKCLVEGCGHVTKSNSGITSHIRTHHPGKVMSKGETYERTTDPVSNPNRNGPKKAKKRKAVTKAVPVITAKAQAIDIPCILRVNIEGLKVAGIYPVTG